MDLEKYIFFILLRKGLGAGAKIGRSLTYVDLENMSALEGKNIGYSQIVYKTIASFALSSVSSSSC